jgi:hypothetical protein
MSVKHALISTLVATSLLVRCSNSPKNIEKPVSNELVKEYNSITLNPILVKKYNTFVLADELLPMQDKQEGILDTKYWPINVKTLCPAFESKRFKCSLKAGECETHVATQSPFLKVSESKNDFGDTYKKRVADGSKTGMTPSEIALTSVAAVFVAPALVVGGAIALMDNGPKLISATLTDWCETNNVELVYIQPGKRNGLVLATGL